MRYFFLILSLAVLTLPAQTATAEPVREFASWVTALRAKHGLGPVKVNTKLEKVAESHAQDMSRKKFFSHTGSNGATIGKRTKRAGYRYCTVGENIAQGQKSAQEAMAAWQGSAGHLKNMLKRGITEIGVARTGDNYWVMVVGGQRGDC